ncbi:hypothetical protein KAU08_11635, partial [bacterium]|nr:hypothetical protein [bacterium]
SFLSKFDRYGNHIWERTFGGSGFSCGIGIAVAETGAIYSIGKFAETVDFCPGNRVENHTSNYSLDIYLLKLLADGTW